MRPREPFTFFIDRCLGKYDVPSAVRNALLAGEAIQIHDDLLAQDTDDEEWLPMVAARGWVVLSKDPAMRRSPLVVEALRAAGAAVFHLANGQISGIQSGAALVATMPRIRKAVRRFDVTVVGSVDMTGSVTVMWASGARLARPVRLK